MARYTCALENDHLEFVRSGAEVYLMLDLALRKYFARPTFAIGKILDFGCGAGRILRFLNPLTKGVYGCDVNEPVVRFAKEHCPNFSIHRNALMPPLAYQAEQFDLVYSFSVFSHLRLDVENQWLSELSRIGKSGCIYLISVHGDWFIESTLGDEAKAVIENGFSWKKVHQRCGTDDDFPEYYEASFHTADYIRDHWSEHFEIVDVVKGDNPIRFLGTDSDDWSRAVAAQLRPMGQDLVIARKR